MATGHNDLINATSCVANRAIPKKKILLVLASLGKLILSLVQELGNKYTTQFSVFLEKLQQSFLEEARL